MAGGMRWRRRLLVVALVAAVEGLATLALTAVAPTSAQAQVGDQFQFLRRQFQRQQRQGGGFFGLFGGGERQPSRRYDSDSDTARDYSRAPAPRKREDEPDPNKPVTSIVVMGGSMGDWLAYGLEDAFSDSPNVEIVRKTQPKSGLLRYKYKTDLDWWHVAREELAQQNANFVIMMLGVYDRQNIRESDVEQEAENEAEKNAQGQQNAATAQNDDKAKEAREKAKRSNAVIEFRSDEWARIYTRRLDRTLAALKSRGVPVLWVGLPSIRGSKSTADAVYLNNLFRARAQRAGVSYIDVWDGFVDDGGKYSSYGPDLEGQTRRLRSGDGVFFTKSGARKIAHYVEREIRRYMSNRVTTLTFPSGPFGPGTGDAKSTTRPVAGPVLPLTAITTTTDVLLGGSDRRPVRADENVTRVLVKGDAISAPPGRADDFKWPPDSEKYGKPPEPPAAGKDKPGGTGPAAAAPAAVMPPLPEPQTQASAPPAALPLTASPATQTDTSAADDARAKAEAQRRAAERSRAQAQQNLRPPARVEPQRQQVERRPQRQPSDPLRELFSLFPR